MKITFLRAIKIWWSFSWRMIVLSFPLVVVLWLFMYWFLLIPKPGQPMTPFDPAHMSGFLLKFFIIWVGMVIGSICIHAFAIQWMMKAKWSDFKLVAVPNEELRSNDLENKKA